MRKPENILKKLKGKTYLDKLRESCKQDFLEIPSKNHTEPSSPIDKTMFVVFKEDIHQGNRASCVKRRNMKVRTQW